MTTGTYFDTNGIVFSNDDLVLDPPPMSPSAGIDEIRQYVDWLDSWRRTREQLAAGGKLAKMVTFRDLIKYGLLTMSDAVVLEPDPDLSSQQPLETFIFLLDTETAACTTGAAKLTFRAPYDAELVAVRASLTTAPTGATFIFDLNESGVSVLSTKLSIDAGEKTSKTAASAVVISDPNLADDAEMTIDFDQVGSAVAGTGPRVTITLRRNSMPIIVANDPYWANVKLLLHFEGADNSTTITDSSSVGWTGYACAGNAHIETTGPLVGASSLALDGTGDYLRSTSMPAAWACGLGNFCLEGFAQLDSLGARRILAVFGDSAAAGGMMFGILDTNALGFNAIGGTFRSLGGTVPLSTKFHWAIFRMSGRVYGALNGVMGNLIGEDYSSDNFLQTTAESAEIGIYAGGSWPFIGLLDEIRFTVGHSRYTVANFTPPVGPFPNS